MTTSVKITHEGPGHHDILVERYDPKTRELYWHARVKEGKSVSFHVYDNSAISVTELPFLELPDGQNKPTS